MQTIFVGILKNSVVAASIPKVFTWAMFVCPSDARDWTIYTSLHYYYNTINTFLSLD